MRKILVLMFALCLAPGLFAQSGTLQTANVTLSSAQIKSLSTTPVQLVPAPGDGNTIVVYSLVSSLNFGTAPYTDAGGAVLYLRYDVGPAAAGTACAVLYNVITASGSETGVDVPNAVINPNPAPIAAVQNKPLVLVNAGSNDFAAGDGTVKLTITYQVVNQ